MIEKTDLDECIEVAIDFLYMDLEMTDIPDIILHPYFQSPYIIDEDSGKLINILENEDNYDSAINQMEEKIYKVENFMEFTDLLTKPYRLAFLKFTKDFLDLKDFSKYLIDTWITDEYVNRNATVSKIELLEYFKNASKELIMDEDDQIVYSNLEEEITIYRGVTDYNKDDTKAMSWTIDKDIAKWFANRFGQEGYIYTAKIHKKDIFAFCNLRNEKEVIVDFNKLFDLELLDI